MDRHEATTAFSGAGVGDVDADTLGAAVELLSSVSGARFLVEAGTVAIDNAGIADLSAPISEEDPPPLEVIEEVAPKPKSRKKS